MPSAADPALAARPWLLGLASLGALLLLGLLGLRALPAPWPLILGVLLALSLSLLLGLAAAGRVLGIPFGFSARAERALLDWTARFAADPGAFHFAWARRGATLEKARESLQQAAERGHREALRELGRDLLEGVQGSVGRSAAVPWLARAAELGDAEAAYWLAEALRWRMVAQGTREEALQAYVQAAQGGYRPALCWLAHAYAVGDGVAADASQAEAWTARAAAMPGPERPGPGLLQQITLRTPALRQAAGELVEAERQIAGWLWELPWFRRLTAVGAAGLGVLVVALAALVVTTSAQSLIGMASLLLLVFLLAFGLIWMHLLGVRLGPGLQRSSLETRAAAGDPEACFALGRRSETGDHAWPRDATAAREWYRRAVDLGHGMALVRLADLLAWGMGGPRDPGEARRLLDRARALGLAEAEAALARMEPLLSDRAPAAEENPAESTP